MVVAHQQQCAAIGGSACHVRVAQRVHGAVHARGLAVPDGKHTLDIGAGESAYILSAPGCGCGQVFVYAGLKDDVVLIKLLRGIP